jgi:hypothetical protein
MTRKDYVRFAAMLKQQRITAMKPEYSEQHDHYHKWFDGIAFDMCKIFANDNPNFDRARFLKACGVES